MPGAGRPGQAAFRLMLLAGLLGGAVLAGPSRAGEGASGWFHVYGNHQETIHLKDGGELPAGHLLGSTLARLADGEFLTAGFVKPSAEVTRHLGVAKFDAGGKVRWYREYRRAPVDPTSYPRSSFLPPNLEPSPAEQAAWAEAVATPDGGAAVAFGSALLKLDAQGEPEWAWRFWRPLLVSAGEAYHKEIVLKSVVRLAQGGYVLLGINPGEPQVGQPGGEIVLIGLDEQGRGRWSKLCQGLLRADRPKLLAAGESLLVGAEPRAVAKLTQAGELVWARSLQGLPFQRGLKYRPDQGEFLRYQTLGLTEDQDIIFSGVYDLSYPSAYRAPGALICRLSPEGQVRWSRRVHSPLHGGETVVRAVACAGSDLYLAGQSTVLGSEVGAIASPNAVALKMTGAGEVAWVASVGRKRQSIGQSEYAAEAAQAVLADGSGGLILAGGADSFAHPLPWLRTVVEWATPHYDLLLARTDSAGALGGLPEGRYPRLLTRHDGADPKRVDLTSPPVAAEALAVAVQAVDVVARPEVWVGQPGELRTRYSTDRLGPGNKPPTADFTVAASGEAAPSAKFDAGLSQDPEGDPLVAYDWTIYGQTKRGRVVTARFPRAGMYEPSLTVTDEYEHKSAALTRKVWVGHVIRGQTIPPGLACGELATHEIEVVTGDPDQAGTDASVYLSLFGPVDARGERCASGEFWLYETISLENSNPFERGQRDRFQIDNHSGLDEVDSAVLRHDNQGSHPGWFVQGFKVRNLKTKKEWHFVPEQWLADDEPPSRATSAEFKPVTPYPGGLVIGGTPGAWGLTMAGDLVGILPAGAEKFYLTNGRRDEDLALYQSNTLLGSQLADGQGRRFPPYLKSTDWGLARQASQVARPTRYEIQTRRSGGEWKKGVAWIFPSTWEKYPATARQATLLYPLKGQTETAFALGSRAKTYLEGQQADLAGALAAIVNYGGQALGIFGDVPDLKLRSYVQPAVEEFFKNKLLLALASKSVELSAEALGDMVEVYTTLLNALEWGQRMGPTIDYGLGLVYQVIILNNLPSKNNSFKNILALFAALRTKVEDLLAKVEANDPQACQTLMGQISHLVLGDLPSLTADRAARLRDDPQAYQIDYRAAGITAGDARGYPLVLELALQVRMARDVWGSRGNDEYPPYFDKPTDVLIDESARKEAAVAAMATYAPLLGEFCKLAAILADACLMP